MPLTTKKTAPAADTNGKDDPGKPQDALTAIVAEISKTPATATPDVKVTRAVAAGWHAREALTAARRADAEAAGSIHPRSHEGHAFLVLQAVARGELHKAFREHPITDDEPLAVAAHDAPPPSFVSDGAAPRGELLGTISDVSAAQRLAVACCTSSARTSPRSSRHSSPAGRTPSLWPQTSRPSRQRPTFTRRRPRGSLAASCRSCWRPTTVSARPTRWAGTWRPSAKRRRTPNSRHDSRRRIRGYANA